MLNMVNHSDQQQQSTTTAQAADLLKVAHSETTGAVLSSGHHQDQVVMVKIKGLETLVSTAQIHEQTVCRHVQAVGALVEATLNLPSTISDMLHHWLHVNKALRNKALDKAQVNLLKDLVISKIMADLILKEIDLRDLVDLNHSASQVVDLVDQAVKEEDHLPNGNIHRLRKNPQQHQHLQQAMDQRHLRKWAFPINRRKAIA